MKRFFHLPFFVLSLFLCASFGAAAQVGIGTTTPDSNAILDLSSTNKGLLIPRMTSSQRMTISTPPAGLMVFDTDSGYVFYYSSGWKGIKATSSASISQWTASGANIYNSNTGNVGIGKTPSYKLDVTGPVNADSLMIGGATIVNTKGTQNLFIGQGAGAIISSGGYNVFTGTYAGYSNTTGSNNSFTGYRAGYSNTTGGQNTFTGTYAGYSNTGGSDNSFTGFRAGYSNISGSNNNFTGYGAGYSNTTGYGNSFIGLNAGSSNTTGYYNTAVGYNAGPLSVGSPYNTIAIGYNVTVGSSNYAVIGNSSMSSIGGYQSWSNLSDGRFKKNIKEDVKGLDFIMKLRPVTYNLDVHKLNTFLGVKGDEDAMNAKEKMVNSGFIAQEVEKAADEAGYNFSGIVKPQNDKDHYSLRYSDFVVPIVKSVQEQQVTIGHLQSQNDSLRQDNMMLKTRVSVLEARLNNNQNPEQGSSSESVAVQMTDIKAQLQALREVQIACCRAQGSLEAAAALDIPVLQQNDPNPFTDNTIIRYYLPSGDTNAQITIGTVNGKIMQSFTSLGTGNGQVVINAGALAAGTYYYNLVIDGRQMDSKKMILVK